MAESKLAAEESRRTLGRDAIKNRVETGIGGEVTDRANHAPDLDHDRVGHVAAELRGRALAIGVFALCHVAITGIFRLVARRKTEI